MHSLNLLLSGHRVANNPMANRGDKTIIVNMFDSVLGVCLDCIQLMITPRADYTRKPGPVCSTKGGKNVFLDADMDLGGDVDQVLLLSEAD